MKGFPNQVADLGKIATGIQTLVRLVDAGDNAKDDGVFGEDLVRVGVAGTGHTPMGVEQYLRLQRTKKPSNQSFRTTARGLRELYRLLGFIDDSGGHVVVTPLGRQAAAFAGAPMDSTQVSFWRNVIQNMTHTGPNATHTSHPYQVLLRLVGQKPGITRAKCALALEARDDSPEELIRIVGLADLPEDEIRRRIGVTQSNWDNAKKVLPAFAEQLSDVIRTGQSFVLADAPGRVDVGPADAASPTGAAPRGRQSRVRAPRSSRAVTPQTIGRAGTGDKSEEVPIPPEMDPAALAEAIRLRQDRLRRHNEIVQEFAAQLTAAELYEDPFDILAVFEEFGILVEVKTLDGTEADERDRVRDALGQLLYYAAFVSKPVVGEAAVHLIACFEGPISDAHRAFLNSKGIGVVWKDGNRFVADELARGVLRGCIEI
jgi:hypothetical protein